MDENISHLHAFRSFGAINAFEETSKLLITCPTNNIRCAREYLDSHLKSAIYQLAEEMEEKGFISSEICRWTDIVYHLKTIWLFTFKDEDQFWVLCNKKIN